MQFIKEISLQKKKRISDCPSVTMVTVAEIEAELERDDKQKKSDDGVATVKHLDRTYMGMLEYKKEEEAQLIKCLIMGEWKNSSSV